MNPDRIVHHARALAILTAVLANAPAIAAPPLLPESTVAALAEEIDGNRAHRDVEFFALHHRMRASQPFHAVTEYIVAELRRAGFDTAEVLTFPADGKTMFGTQKSRPAWDAEFAELWELEQRDGEWMRRARLASWDAMPLSLAQDSESGEAITDLVDVGAGTEEQDYAGKAVGGKLVLVSSQPEAVQSLAIERFGAAGIVSYAQNQKTAWWREDENLVRWGHLSSFAESKPFAFMVSLKQARAFQARLAAGDVVRLEAKVRAGRHAGEYEIATATIPGSDPQLAQQEVAFSCHMDHPRPGANDNASGCATILEVARAYAELISEGKLARPLRTIRFMWPPEIEGSTILLNARPDLARRIVAVVHMDMVGGGPETKAVFHVTRSPASLPNFVNDVAETFAEFVNAQSEAYAAGRDASYPLVAPGGGREALLAQAKEFDAGSDHVVYTDSSFRIPTIYLNDWPDRYIHTTGDVPSNIDPTKLERAGFIGAASAWYIANLSARDMPDLLALLERKSLERTAKMMKLRAGLEPPEQGALEALHRYYESAIAESIEKIEPVAGDDRASRERFLARVAGLTTRAAPSRSPKGTVYTRCAEPKGPMTVFGYDYLEDHFGRERTAALPLTSFEGVRGGPEEYAIEVLNFVDGRRGAQEIRDSVAAEFGPVPLDDVAGYLSALAEIKVIAEDPAVCITH